MESVRKRKKVRTLRNGRIICKRENDRGPD